jgi:hypothetical protein
VNIGTTAVALNRTSTSLALTGVSIDGNAGTVTNGFYTSSSFNLGTTSIAVNRASAAQTLSGVSISGNAGTAATLETARTINGTSFNGSANITTSSWGTARTLTIGSTGKSVNGSAAVSWSLSEIGAAASNQTMYIGTTAVTIDRASGNLSLTGVSIDGNAGTVTNGVYTSGDQTIGGAKTFTSKFLINKTTTVTVGTNGGSDQFELQNNSSGGCIVSFHRAGAYAINMGLDTDNVFRLGGWSNGPNTYRWTSDTSGNFTAQGNITALSDIRLKTDLAPIENALEKVNQLTGYTFTRTDTGTRQTGLVAQEVQKVLPEAVLDGEHLSLAYGNMIGLLIEAIKEQQKTISELSLKIRKIENLL